MTFIYCNKVYASVANIIYDGNVLKISQSATQYKLIFAFILRFIDGLLGLYVNFALMLDTSGALNIMLNFAALHFLQGTLYTSRLNLFLLKLADAKLQANEERRNKKEDEDQYNNVDNISWYQSITFHETPEEMDGVKFHPCVVIQLSMACQFWTLFLDFVSIFIAFFV